MSRHRNPRRRARRNYLSAENRTMVVGISLAENPNRAKRHAAKLAYMEGFVTELARAERDAYSPLTVSTRFTRSDGRRYPDKRDTIGAPSPASYSSYTV